MKYVFVKWNFVSTILYSEIFYTGNLTRSLRLF